MDAASGAANSFATGNLVINILLGSSLKFLWGMINTLQFVVFFTEWEVIIPLNALFVIETLRTIALGEFIEYGWLTEPLSEPFKSPDEEGEDDEDNSRANVLSNMGIMLFFGGVILVLAVVTVLLFRCCKPGQKLYSIGQKIKRKIFWNMILRFVLQSYLKNALAILFSIYVISFAEETKSINASVALVLLLAMIAFPIIFGAILQKKRD